MATCDDRDGDLTAQQWQAVRHLLRTGDPADTAQHVRISERQLRRWRASEPFKTALRTAGRDAAREAASRTMAVQGEAVSVLVAAMTSERAPWPVRVSAAGRLLDHGDRVAADDIDERLDDLERRAAAWPDTAAPYAWPA